MLGRTSGATRREDRTANERVTADGVDSGQDHETVRVVGRRRRRIDTI